MRSLYPFLNVNSLCFLFENSRQACTCRQAGSSGTWFPYLPRNPRLLGGSSCNRGTSFPCGPRGSRKTRHSGTWFPYLPRDPRILADSGAIAVRRSLSRQWAGGSTTECASLTCRGPRPPPALAAGRTKKTSPTKELAFLLLPETDYRLARRMCATPWASSFWKLPISPKRTA
jgi:hypothetical protein